MTISQMLEEHSCPVYVKDAKGLQSNCVFKVSRGHNGNYSIQTQDPLLAKSFSLLAPIKSGADGVCYFCEVESLAKASVIADFKHRWIMETELDSLRVNGRRVEFRFIVGRFDLAEPYTLVGFYGKHFFGEAGGKIAGQFPVQDLLTKVIGNLPQGKNLNAEKEFHALVDSLERFSMGLLSLSDCKFDFCRKLIAIDLCPIWQDGLKYGFVEGNPTDFSCDKSTETRMGLLATGLGVAQPWAYGCLKEMFEEFQ